MYQYEIIFAKNSENKEEELNKILKIVAKNFGRYSLSSQFGGYIMSNGDLVEEESLSLKILTEDREEYKKIREICIDIRELFEQESVLISETKVKYKFI